MQSVLDSTSYSDNYNLDYESLRSWDMPTLYPDLNLSAVYPDLQPFETFPSPPPERSREHSIQPARQVIVHHQNPRPLRKKSLQKKIQAPYFSAIEALEQNDFGHKQQTTSRIKRTSHFENPIAKRSKKSKEEMPKATRGYASTAKFVSDLLAHSSTQVKRIDENGNEVIETKFNCDIIEKPEFFRLVRKEYEHDIQPKRYRRIIRQVVSPQQGYVKVDLPEPLEKMLKEQFRILGKKKWNFVNNLSSEESDSKPTKKKRKMNDVNVGIIKSEPEVKPKMSAQHVAQFPHYSIPVQQQLGRPMEYNPLRVEQHQRMGYPPHHHQTFTSNFHYPSAQQQFSQHQAHNPRSTESDSYSNVDQLLYPSYTVDYSTHGNSHTFDSLDIDQSSWNRTRADEENSKYLGDDHDQVGYSMDNIAPIAPSDAQTHHNYTYNQTKSA